MALYKDIEEELALFLENYEFESDCGSHRLTEFEQCIVIDAIAGFLHEKNTLSEILNRESALTP